MRDDNFKKNKISWPKTLVKKWFNNRTKADEFYTDGVVYKDRSSKQNSDRVRRNKIELEDSQVTDVHNHRVFVATWNVAGKTPPPSDLNLEDWLHASPPADIYVLGFQEIVPLNAGNVLGTEDNGPAIKWLELIQKTLDNIPGTNGYYHTSSPIPDSILESDIDLEGSSRQMTSSFIHRRSFQSLNKSRRLDHRFSVCDRVMYGHRDSNYDPNYRWGYWDDDYDVSCVPYIEPNPMKLRYCLVASRQMVGIFLTVWIRSGLKDSVGNMKVSCVGRGLMGYLGNKGSISISMSLHQTSFCFICSHLTSGQKEGDELRRNSDVIEILRKTRFPRVHGTGDENSPQTILEHDRIIWLGDLNYRIALPYRMTKALVEMCNWRALLENDQLRVEQRHGRIFEGWDEGRIYFPPTYKYSNNSDRYAGDNKNPKEKRRTPAWCDRILWYGRGLHQISYVRGESRFSDHRPVYGIFLAEVESLNQNKTKKSSSLSSSRIEVEELLPHLHGYNHHHFY